MNTVTGKGDREARVRAILEAELAPASIVIQMMMLSKYIKEEEA